MSVRLTLTRDLIERPVRWSALAYFSIAITLSACGSGGSDNSDATPDIGAANTALDSPSASSLQLKSSFSDDDIRHFLSRTHFGIEPGKVEAISSTGLSIYIDQMMEFAPLNTQPFEADAALLLADEDDPAALTGKFPGESDIASWNIELMIRNPNAFQEVMGMFWQDHFGVDVRNLDNDEHHLMVNYINLLRTKSIGNIRNLMVDVSRHGAMLIFLDGADNSKFAPNENYAREFWELFTLGVDNGYSQNDIIEASRAFTGWRREFNPSTGLTRVVFDPTNKAIGSKLPLGIGIEHNLDTDDYPTMVDITMELRGDRNENLVSEYMAEKLLRWFAQERPTDSLIDAFAQTLRQNNLNLAPSLKTLFQSEAFYSAASKEGLVRDFYEQVIGLVRTTGLTETHSTYRNYLSNMASLPTRPPSVEGWPEGDDKLNAQGNGIEIPNFVNELITNRSSQEEAGYDIASALQPADASGPGEVVDHVAELLGVSLDDEERVMIINYMNVQIDNDGDETPLTYTPQNTDHQSRKLRNLLWILCQHPSFHLK